MMSTTPLYISPKGGSIICFSTDTKRLFQSCSTRQCSFSRNLHSAKKQLEKLESNLLISSQQRKKVSPQRKTTLKWNANGELSAVDKARILDLLEPPELRECNLACDIFE